MLYPTETNWTEWRITAPSHRFFVLRWFEIIDPNTFGSWQIRTANIRSILEELEEAARNCARLPRHHTNVRALLDELDTILRNDITVKKHRPVILQHSARLDQLYSDALKQAKNPRPDEFVRLCRIARSELSGYLS